MNPMPADLHCLKTFAMDARRVAPGHQGPQPLFGRGAGEQAMT